MIYDNTFYILKINRELRFCRNFYNNRFCKKVMRVRSMMCQGILSSEIKDSKGFILPRGDYRTPAGLYTNER